VDEDLPAQTLSYRLLEGPSGSVLTNGVFAWTPDETLGGSSAVLKIAVSDGGFSVTNTVGLSVLEVNQPPVPTPLGTRRVSEGNLLSFTVGATDADLPAQRLSYSAVAAPAGVTVSSNGVVSWRPTEAQGPSTNVVLIRVSDDSRPALSATNAIQIVVNEVNQPPVWTTVVATRRVNEGALMSFSVVATDADLPAQPLTNRLVSSPWGLTLSTNGVVSWRPTEVQGASTNRVRITVSDGIASVPLEFDVIVRDAITGSPGPTLGLSARVDGSWTLRVAGIGGGRYQVEQRTQLSGTWSPVPGVPEVLTEGTTVPTSIVLPANASPGLFIRLRKLD
jgi:hypothetical protein